MLRRVLAERTQRGAGEMTLAAFALPPLARLVARRQIIRLCRAPARMSIALGRDKALIEDMSLCQRLSE